MKKFCPILLAAISCTLLAGALSSCGLTPSTAVVPAEIAPPPAPDLSPGSALMAITAATAQTVRLAPSFRPYVQSVANTVRRCATKTAPSPANVQGALALLVAVVPAAHAVADAINAQYTRLYPSIAIAENASPLIEQIAEAIEAGAR